MFWRTLVRGTLWSPLRPPPVGDTKKEIEALFSACPRGNKALSGSSLTNPTEGSPKMRSSIQWIMPLCVTTSPLCLVTFPSETKQPPASGSHHQAGLAKWSPRPEGAGPWPWLLPRWWHTGLGAPGPGIMRGEASGWSFLSLHQARLRPDSNRPLHHFGAYIGCCKTDQVDTFLRSVTDSNIIYQWKGRILSFESYQHKLEGEKRNFSSGGGNRLWEPSA